jgi:hypothetical protein
MGHSQKKISVDYLRTGQNLLARGRNGSGHAGDANARFVVFLSAWDPGENLRDFA